MILTYNDFINENKEGAYNTIQTYSREIADAGRSIKNKMADERYGKLYDIDTKIAELTKSRDEEKDKTRRKEIQKEIQKYAIKKRNLHRVNNFWG